MSAETKLVLIRRSRALPFGMDLIDSRDGFALAWARLHTAHVVAGRVNETYPDLELAPGHEALMLELAWLMHCVREGGGDEVAHRFMLPSREQAELVEVLSELVGWVGRRVSVFVGHPGQPGAASFTATLTGVDPEAEGNEFVLIRFEESPGFVDLDPEVMTAFRIRLEPLGIHWLEFEKGARRVLSIQPLDGSDETGGES